MRKWNLIPVSPSSLPPPPPPPPSITALLRRGLLPLALRVSASHHPLSLTLQIFTLFLKSTSFLDLHLGTLLVSRFSSSGDLARARGLLLHMPATDTAAWNALIAGCARHNLIEPAFQSFYELQLHGLRPDAFTFSSLLKAASDDVRETQIAHGVSFKSGFNSGVFVITGLLHNYSKAGDLVSAEKCFEESLVSDPVVWTAMVSGYVKNGELDSALEVFMQMWCSGLGSNEFCLSSVLAALADDCRGVEQGMQVHGLSVKMGFLPFGSTPLSNALLSMYCRCGTVDDGLRAFGEIQEPDVVSWSTLLMVFDAVGVLQLFRFLCSSDMEINEYTVINVLSAISDPRLIRCGKQIHGWCLRSGFLLVISVSNALISMYGKCRDVVGARQVFGEMPARDLVSWNALLAVYAANSLPDLALGLFSHMQHSSLEPNTSTLATLSEAVSSSADLMLVMRIHSSIIKSGHIRYDCMVTSLIAAYGKCDRIEELVKVFGEAEERALVHINAMAAAFVQAGYHAEALKLFKNARSLGGEIDSGTLSVVLKACCALTSIEQGKSMQSLALKLGIGGENFVGSAMIDIYCKCGSLEDAVKVFEELPRGSLATWNAMISGYAQHGNHDEVMEKFKRMKESGVDPDEITFLGVLYSCCHAGHVEGAYHYIDSMLEDHGLIPSLEHYSCVIDLLGRVGCLKEAKSRIDRMPLTPDARIWQAFLTACGIHGNMLLGEVAAQELLKLEPDNDSAYVLLSNIYAAAGMWDEVRKMRRGMRERTVCKEPGCSWIQVRGSAQSFFASDTAHPETLRIYLMLEELNKQMMVVQLIGDGCLIEDQDLAGQVFREDRIN